MSGALNRSSATGRLADYADLFLYLPFRPRLTGLIRPVCPPPAMDLTRPPVGVGTSIWRNRLPQPSQTSCCEGRPRTSWFARGVGVGEVRRVRSARESVAATGHR